MSDVYKVNPLVLIGVPTLEKQPISWEWSDMFASLQVPLGAAHSRYRVHGKIIADARNEIAARALEINADWLLFISDDVIPPPNIFEILARHKQMLVTGVYWTKQYPRQPYIWRDILRGPFNDWKYGEFFKVDWAGCDALLINTDVLRAIEYPWFSHDWCFTEDQPRVPLATEDLYFYTKAKKAGFDLWCDAACQCLHQDRSTKICYGLDTTMPQHEAYVSTKRRQEGKILIADIGCGAWTPHFENAIVKRFDINPEARPDVLCDVRAIPEQDETFDKIYSNHVLEHFIADEAPALLKEWSRILKDGGEIEVRVPNIEVAAREVLKAAENIDYDASYAFGMIYGYRDNIKLASPNDRQLHRCGYTKNGLIRLFVQAGYFGNIEVAEAGYDGECSLTVKAKKVKSSKPLAVLPIWKSQLEEKSSTVVEDVVDGVVENEMAVVDK